MLALGGPAVAAEGEPGTETAECGVGKVSFKVEISPAGSGSLVRVLREGKAPLTVPFPPGARLSLWEPDLELQTACEEAVGGVSGNAVVIVLAERSQPGSPKAAAFVYRLASHKVDGATLDIGPFSKTARARFQPKAACFASSTPSAGKETCYRHECGKARGTPIVKVEEGLGFDEWLCLEATASGLKVRVDPELTYKAASDERLPAAYPSLAAFEKAFGWTPSTGRFRVHAFAVATLEDSTRCLAPLAEGVDLKAEKSWACPAAPPSRPPETPKPRHPGRGQGFGSLPMGEGDR